MAVFGPLMQKKRAPEENRQVVCLEDANGVLT